MDSIDNKGHCDSSLEASETSLYENGPSAEKRMKFDDSDSNSAYHSTYNEVQHVAVHKYQHRSREPILEKNRGQQIPVAEYSEISSASEGYRTPSPDFTPNASHTSSPVVLGYPRSESSCSVIVQSTTTVPTESKPTEEGEHNYVVHSPPSCGTVSGTEGSPPAIGHPNHTTDSGNATLAVEESLYSTDWVQPFALRRIDGDMLVQELTLLVDRSNTRRERYMITRMGELPTSLDYNPNKSRLRKVYADPSQAAERERNNLASRRSRFKKKITQQITNLYLEYNRNENGILMAIMGWMKVVIKDLEHQMLDHGFAEQSIAQMQQRCGYIPVDEPKNPE